MTRQFKLPDLGEGVQEGQVLRLLVGEGETVTEDQLIMEVETDKAAVEIPSPYAGVIAQWHVSEQQVVNVGDLMVTFGDGVGAPVDASTGTSAKTRVAGDGALRSSPAASPAASPSARPAASRAGSADARPAPAFTTPNDGSTGRRTPASPAVRKLARTLGVDLETVRGSGPGGRVVRADVEAARGAGVGASTSSASHPRLETAAAEARPRMTPPGPVPRASFELPAGRDDTDSSGPVRRVAITQTRKAIATVMTRSTTTIPHVTDCDDADVTDLDRLRRGYNDPNRTDGGPGAKIGMFAFVVRAVARALHDHPLFNGSFDEAAGEIVYRRNINIAVGVHTERGLVAPVLHEVDRLSVSEINARLFVLAEKARAGTFALDDTRGATYTISNAGAMGGSRYSTPIITPPQVAVLAIGKTRLQPSVIDGAVVPRLVMPLSHSMDHRVIDGGLEIAFMRQLIGDLENPGRMLL